MLALVVALLPIAVGVYAYAGYPCALLVMKALRHKPALENGESAWPSISITVPCYNEAGRLRETLTGLLALDYPPDRQQIIVISDASTDATDDIAREFSTDGVELVRLTERRGKSAAENAATEAVRGDIVVNVDAATRIPPESLRELLAPFKDPRVGLATGRNVSVATRDTAAPGEKGYVGYDMWVRTLETHVGSVVGASGCFYAIRRELYDRQFPEEIDRDFASALVAWEHGYRAVAVDTAVCYIPQATSLAAEYRRKVRTMSRGLRTLNYKRHLLNPAQNPMLAWMLFSHKLARWLVFPLLPVAFLAVLVMSWSSPQWRWGLGGITLAAAVGLVALYRGNGGSVSGILGPPAFATMAIMAGNLAWWRALFGGSLAKWEPTRR